jgi:succinate-semialdehyde dehydrogenase/glutarate-semialdehyde dehydrogenase
MSIQTVNPNTNKVVKSFEEMSDKAVDAAVAQAEKAYTSWRKTTYEQRAVVLHKVASLMREKKEQLATLITLEMGKLFAQAEGEVILSANIIDYYADHAKEFLGDKHLSPEHGKAIIRHSPIGVLFGVEPWNFPLYQVARFAYVLVAVMKITGEVRKLN